MSADPALLQHIENISKLCRICGQAVLKKRDKQKMYQPNPCRKYARRIHEIWGVDVTKDRGHRHPPAFCHRCRSKLARPPHFSRPKVVTWYDHDAFEGHCAACEKVASIAKGGRPTKIKPPGRPRSQPKQDDDKQEQQNETTAKLEEDNKLVGEHK
ncbi:PREDICTED: uncharacterized protein LOC109466858 [Branchiostoma belcheri]|uniref:Uncharacterized protein LOC109466858 n=1 Tax=Branchiostoma belcheri TaxID=7741 RepID=A0A6P4YNJ9_BRABE|nr:PREDICTED: uncharacterized protein LOC109466858 [Branchiostoma belcheri]